MPRVTETSDEIAGALIRTCPVCETVFRTDNPRTKYCSLVCKKARDNQRYYAAHADTLSATNNERQKAQRKLLKELLEQQE
jgi:hypothetical protein